VSGVKHSIAKGNRNTENKKMKDMNTTEIMTTRCRMQAARKMCKRIVKINH
jgi:hypothetical protein